MASQPQNHDNLEKLLGESPRLVHARIAPLSKALVQSGTQTHVKWSSLKASLADNPADLVEIMAQVLPLRQAIFWGLVCGQACQAFGQGGTAADSVQTSLQWAMKPDESLRKRAAGLADTLPWQSAEGLLARAVALV